MSRGSTACAAVRQTVQACRPALRQPPAAFMPHMHATTQGTGRTAAKSSTTSPLTGSAPPQRPAPAAGHANLQARRHHWTHSLPNPNLAHPVLTGSAPSLCERHAPLPHQTLAMLSRSKHNGANPSHTTPTSQVLLHYVVRLDIPAAERYSNPTPTPKPQLLTGSAPPHHRAACRS